MKLILKLKNENEFVASYADVMLEISEKSEEWNTEGINKFLINLATRTPDGDIIELELDQEQFENNKIYKHLCNLFNEFVKEYNKCVLEEK